jgi:hypothetical protein
MVAMALTTLTTTRTTMVGTTTRTITEGRTMVKDLPRLPLLIIMHQITITGTVWKAIYSTRIRLSILML